MNTIIINQKNSEELYEQGMQELTNNHIKFAKNYFRKAALKGHKCANKFLMFLCCSKDPALARDLILCAEGRV